MNTGSIWREPKIYIKRSWNLDEESMIFNWKGHEIYIRSWGNPYEEKMGYIKILRSTSREQKIYTKRTWDLHGSKWREFRSTNRDHEHYMEREKALYKGGMRSTWRGNEIYMKGAWDLYIKDNEINNNRAWREHGIYRKRSWDLHEGRS